MDMKLGYKHTLFTCCVSYTVQAVVNNFSPLLYAFFAERLGVELAEISLLITVNFIIQIGMDFIGTVLADKIGYRASAALGNAFALLGLILLGTLPQVMESKLLALLIATAVSAVGGGLLEVIVSPIVEALPKDEVSFSMSFLHSFYCWGHVAVILLSTVFFLLVGIDRWYIMAFVWGILPLASGIMLLLVPIRSLGGGSTGSSVKYLFGKKQFWLLMTVMLAAGAAELSMAQWASYFAECGLGVTKTLGDLLGPCAFAVAMATTRLLFGIYGKRLRIEKCLAVSFVLCTLTYLIAALAENPFVSLLGCMLCGATVALLWPGSYTLGAEILPRGGTPMFALFALAGDLGAAAGPTLVALVSDGITGGSLTAPSFIFGEASSVGIRSGLLLAAVFPLVAALVCLLLIRVAKTKPKVK